MKFTLPLACLAALFCAACTTTSNRREMYHSNQANGYWTKHYRNLTLAGRDDHQLEDYLTPVVKDETAPPPQNQLVPLPPAPAAQ